MDTNIIKKMSVKTLGCVPEQAVVDKTRVHMCRIIGQCMGTETKDDSKGDAYTKIIGNFEGTNAKTGEVFQSAILYLPGGFHEAITAQYEGGKKPLITLAVDIFCKPATNARGYEYDMTNVVPMQGVGDPLMALREQAKGILPGKSGAAIAAITPPKPESAQQQSAKRA